MAYQMTDEQRLQTLEAYNPAEHLVQIRAKDGTLKDYLPTISGCTNCGCESHISPLNLR